jgi:hypothetical protein
VLFGYFIVRFIRRPAVPDEPHGNFSEALASTQTASSVYEKEDE